MPSSVNYDTVDTTPKTAIPPAAARASSTNGTAVDTLVATGKQSKGVHFVFQTGVVTDGTYTLSVEESDSSGSGYTAVPAGRLFSSVGTIPATADDTAFQLSAKVDKRWCRLVVTAAGTTTGAIYSATALLKEI